jgi:regulator of cell morphogenesis and NO signaling
VRGAHRSLATSLLERPAMNIDVESPVSDIVVAIPGAARVLDELRIDYSSPGGPTLAGACAAAGVDVDEMIAKLEREQAAEERKAFARAPDWRKRPLAELVRHLVETHHVFTRQALDRVHALIPKLEQQDAHLTQLATFIAALEDELRPHLMKEERVLFPYVVALEGTAPGIAPFGHVKNPIRVMLLEHEAAEELLHVMREHTSGYALAADAPPALRQLYETLEELEMDLKLHIHLENDVLFPRAVEFEVAHRGEP